MNNQIFDGELELLDDDFWSPEEELFAEVTHLSGSQSNDEIWD